MSSDKPTETAEPQHIEGPGGEAYGHASTTPPHEEINYPPEESTADTPADEPAPVTDPTSSTPTKRLPK